MLYSVSASCRCVYVSVWEHAPAQTLQVNRLRRQDLQYCVFLVYDDDQTYVGPGRRRVKEPSIMDPRLTLAPIHDYTRPYADHVHSAPLPIEPITLTCRRSSSEFIPPIIQIMQPAIHCVDNLGSVRSASLLHSSFTCLTCVLIVPLI